RLLEVASVLGKDFELGPLAAVVAMDEPAVLHELEPALSAHVIEAPARSEKQFRFIHVLIRDVLYDRLGATRRADLHGRVATTLEQLDPYRDRFASELAYHFAHAAGSRASEQAYHY